MQGVTALDLIVKNNEMCGVVLANDEKILLLFKAKAYCILF